MASHTSLQATNVGESQQVREPPYTVGGNAHWQQSLEKTVSTCQKLKCQIVKPRSDIPTPGLYPEKTIIQKDT